MSTTNSAPLDAADSHRIILMLGMLTAFAPFATDMFLAGFPDIARSMHTSVDRVQLSLSTFVFGLAFGQLFYGPLSDRFGRRIPLLFGIALFTFSSALSLFVSDINSFIALRFVQALGGCAGMVLSRAIIRDLFESRQAAQALSTMMTVQGAGPIIAPILGGYLLGLFGWQSAFVFLTIFSGLCWILVARKLPETLPPARRQKQSPAQVLNTFWRLLRQREFIVPTLSGCVASSSMFAFISGSPFVFITLHGVSAQNYGWLFGLNAVGMILASQLNRRLLRRFSPAALLRAALLVNVLAGVALVAAVPSDKVWLFVLPLFLCLSTIPVIGANCTVLAMDSCSAHAGSASSLMGVLRFSFAGLTSTLISLLHNGSAYPMSIAILCCGALGFLLLRLGGRPPQHSLTCSQAAG